MATAKWYTVLVIVQKQIGTQEKHMQKGFKMAFASLANTSKISGTKVNTVVIDDPWTEWTPKKAEPAEPVYLNFNTPPLALVLAMQESGKASNEIYATLQGVGKSKINTENVVTVEHQKSAAEIYDYFAKKHTMRRLKCEYISKYMLAVDELCENRKRINEEHLKVLVSLPRIYNQNRSLERVMKGRNSAKKIETFSFAAWRGEVEFVEKVELKFGGRTEVQYYFSTPKNYLMRVVVKKGEYGETAWNFLSKKEKLYIDANVVYTYNVSGYDFNVLQPTPDAEIKEIE
jgi:hypothetical protein